MSLRGTDFNLNCIVHERANDRISHRFGWLFLRTIRREKYVRTSPLRRYSGRAKVQKRTSGILNTTAKMNRTTRVDLCPGAPTQSPRNARSRQYRRGGIAG